MSRASITRASREGDDPLASLRQCGRRTTSCGLAIVIIAAVWAAWPLDAPAVPNVTLNQPVAPDEQRPRPLNLSGFGARLWPVPAPTEASSPPPPPLRLQLVGITSAPGGSGPLSKFVAAVYDPDSDRLLVLAEGDRVASRTVIEVSPQLVRLRDNARREWSLRLATRGQKGAGS